MADKVQFDFAVPEELLQEVVAKTSDPEVVAALDVMPGTGEGKAPPLIGILRRNGFAPLVLLTAAALIPGTVGNGISLVGTNLEHSFHIHDAALGAVTFVGAVAQLLWAVPLALWADRGSRKVVAGVALLVFSVFTPLMALAPNVWAFTFLYLIASVGYGVNNTVHNSYLSDAYPTEGRGRIFSWHNLSDPLSQTVGHPHLRAGGDRRPQLAVGHAHRPGRDPPRPGPVHPARAGQGGERVEPHPQGLGYGPPLPAERRARGSCWARPSPGCCGSAPSTTSWWRWPSSASPAPPPRCSGTCTSSGGGASTPRRAARSTRSSAWPPSSACPWPTCSATGSSDGPRNGRWSSPGSASPPTAPSTSPPSTCPSCGWW